MKPWPWPQADEGLYRQTRAMLAATEGLSITGWETACKFSPAGLASGRLLQGFSPQGVAAKRLRELPQRLGMPGLAAAEFLRDLGASSQVLLAVEHGPLQSVAKAYLEFPLISSEAGAPGCLHLIGYKWPIPQVSGDAPTVRRTQYRWHRGAEAALAQAASREAVASTQPSPSALMAQALQWAAGRKPGLRPARLLSVSEDASPRASWAAKFYDSSLRIADLRLGVSGLAAAWGLDADQVDVVFDAIGGRELGWLAAGTGSDAR
ncbi:MAG: hypothetical protein EBY28_25580, partial [Betaproteobacteria bacterium]|nr:hypothetical protein [Betaproteobacteria bacterium]